MAHHPNNTLVVLAWTELDDGGPVQAATEVAPEPQDPLNLRFCGDAVRQSEILLLGLLGCTFPHETWLNQ